MNEENKEFKNWEEVIVDFFENKISKSKLFKARKYIVDKNTDIKKDVTKLEKLKIARDKKQKELIQLRKDAPKTEINDWIENNYSESIAEGNRTIKATHVLKFTHGSSIPGGLLLKEKSDDLKEKSDDLLLSTASLKRKLTLDLAHKNGAHISISRFLGLQLSGEMIIDCILRNEFEFLNTFKKDKKQFEKWKNGFSNLVEIREIKTTDKAKQTYFPLTETTTEEYHLITPLFASSLCNEIDVVISKLKYGEQQKEINKCRNHKKYHQSLYVDYPNLAVQNFGGVHAKNISMLNANRSGKVYLFSNQPPTWQSQLKPPINKSSMFDNYSHLQSTKENIDYLRDYLLHFESIDLSIKNPGRKKWIKKWVKCIIDDFLSYVATIQNLPSGWSNADNIKLKIEHQYFLDPHRKDEDFQEKRKSSDWQIVICNDFSSWLNNKLRGKDEKFTPQREHARMWEKLIETQLREYEETVGYEEKI